MAVIDRSVRGITRCVGPTRFGALLARLAQRRYSHVWANNGENEVITEHSDRGLRMRVDRTHHIGGAIYWRGFHSRRLLRCLDRLLRPDMTLIDVGANQGEVTLYAARRLPKGSVIAFEPVHEHHRRLLHNVQLNGLTNVASYNCCLGDRHGQVQLFAAETQSHKHRHGWNEGLASMFAAGSQSIPFSKTEVHRLDDVFPNLNVNRLDVLKVDVEGAELHVLHGARESITRFRPYIILEINAETFQSAGYAVNDLCAFLRDLDYEGFQIDRSGRRGKGSPQNFPDFCDTLWTPPSNKPTTRSGENHQKVLT